ncbi:hypothetical protein WME94_26910 [Sorangium sp. So ce429]
MDLNKLDTILSGGLWFARLDKFNDRLEGALPEANRLGLLAKLPKNSAAWVEREYERSVLRSYALCWHINDSDPDFHVWDVFGDQRDGVAVRTDCKCLRDALSQIVGLDGPVHFGAIRYVDHNADTIPEGNVIEAAFVVRSDYADEREARALIHTYGTAAFEHLVGKSGFFGPLVTPTSGTSSPSGTHELVGAHADGAAIVLKVDPRKLISEILPEPSSSLHDLWRLLTVARRHGFAQRVRVSGLPRRILRWMAIVRQTISG